MGRVGAGEARFVAGYEWTGAQDWFGGFSALEMADDGASAMLLSDRAVLAKARIIRDQDGRITGMEQLRHWRLHSSSGKPLAGPLADSEGLAVAPDGTLYISFENIHRVARYDRPGAAAQVLNDPETFRGLPGNGSLEALAIDARGRLYTMPESGRDARGMIPVYRRDPDGWHVVFSLPARGRFLPVGADFGPDGRLYVLERAVGLLGFRSRLRRWSVTEAGAGEEEMLLQTAPGAHDNLEGLSVWRDGAGRLRATMVSDDNFFALQRTELVEYTLPE